MSSTVLTVRRPLWGCSNRPGGIRLLAGVTRRALRFGVGGLRRLPSIDGAVGMTAGRAADSPPAQSDDNRGTFPSAAARSPAERAIGFLLIGRHIVGSIERRSVRETSLDRRDPGVAKGEAMNGARPVTRTIVHLSLVALAGVLLTLVPARPSFAASTFFTCKSVDVAVFPERIHVRCTQPAVWNVVFFAVSTANSAHAARILSALLVAHSVGKNVVVEFEPNDTTGTAFGCAANDCRRLLSVAVP